MPKVMCFIMIFYSTNNVLSLSSRPPMSVLVLSSPFCLPVSSVLTCPLLSLSFVVLIFPLTIFLLIFKLHTKSRLEFNTRENIWTVSLSDGPVSFNMMRSSCLHFPVNDAILFSFISVAHFMGGEGPGQVK